MELGIFSPKLEKVAPLLFSNISRVLLEQCLCVLNHAVHCLAFSVFKEVGIVNHILQMRKQALES